MNYFKILFYSSFLLLLSGCKTGYLSTQETIVPLLTFHQYASHPMFFRSVSLNNEGLSDSGNEITSRLRQGFSSYYNARFQARANYRANLDLTVRKQEVTKEYIQVGSNNDVFSSWKSFDRYVFVSDIAISVKCYNQGSESIESMVISKQVKVPASYSLYERDLYLLSMLEKYIDNIDKEILPYINGQQALCR